MGGENPPHILPLAAKDKFMYDAGPPGRGSEKAELIVLGLHKYVVKF